MSGSSLDGLDLGCWKIKISKDFKLYYKCLHSETIEYSHSEIDFLKSVRNISEYSEYFDDKVYKTLIKRNVRLGEAPSHGKPILLYDASSVGAQNYMELASEILEKNE